MQIDAPVDWSIEMSGLDPQAPLHAELSLESSSGGLFVRGRATALVIHTCHRCLHAWSELIEAEVAEMVGGDGDYPMAGDEIDLEAPLRDAMILTLPVLPLCREDCRGLCSRCGADLNTGSCPGHDEEPDTPFTALRQLLEP